jgi:hypothetical protein
MYALIFTSRNQEMKPNRDAFSFICVHKNEIQWFDDSYWQTGAKPQGGPLAGPMCKQ